MLLTYPSLRRIRTTLSVVAVGYLLFVLPVTFRFHWNATYRSSKKQATALRNRSAEPLLCIFTTFKSAPYKQPIYVNTLHNWVSLDKDRIRPILYDATMAKVGNHTLVKMARQLGWMVYQVPRASKSGIPYLKDMYFDAAQRVNNCTFYGFSNGDILYSRSLVHTLDAVAKELRSLGRTLVVGRRTNVFVSKQKALFQPAEVEETARADGKLFIVNAEDYFFVAGNQFPWREIPDIVIGRISYDNYLVYQAIENDVSVVDATLTLTALHQSDRDGNRAGHHYKEKRINKRILGKFDFRRGLTSSAQYYTEKSDGRVTLWLRAAGSGSESGSDNAQTSSRRRRRLRRRRMGRGGPSPAGDS